MTIDDIFAQDLPIIEDKLIEYISQIDDKRIDVLNSSMKYSLLNSGKRIRPVLTMEFCKAFGGNVNDCLQFACAVELIHTYSLIHDDLPCMDNDDIRRGKPSNHKVYGETIALLAGDALLTFAFEVATNLSDFARTNCDKTLRCANILSRLSGSAGMVGGQVIDILSENKRVDLDTLYAMDKGKTEAIIVAACQMGTIIAGGSEKDIENARIYAESIGLAFQIQDDILDNTSDTATLGKPVGSDVDKQKSTFYSLLGKEKCVQLVDELTQKAISSIEYLGENSQNLKNIALYLANRKK